jgi:hypothetical protein
MRMVRTVSAAVAACLLLLAAPLAAQEVLTNDTVIAMKKAGLSEGVILAKIRSSQTKFDTSTQSLVALKQAGLSDQVIEAMLGHTGPGGGAAPLTTGPATAAVTGPRAHGIAALAQGRETIFHQRGDQYVELVAAVATLETNFAFFQSKSEIVLKGRKSGYRIGDRQPVFYSLWAPNEAPLVKLKPGDDHDDRNLKISSGAFMPFGGTHKMGVRTEDTLDVEAEKDPRGFFRIKPKQPLPPGEYGFILTHGITAGSAGKIFDFGVD